MGRQVTSGQLSLVPQPAEWCKTDWHCLVCGAAPSVLGWDKDHVPNTMRCGVCGMPYAYPFIHPGSKKRYVPKAAYGIDWRRVWKRAWRYYGKGNLVAIFMSEFKTWQSANNAMNRLDGGLIQPPESETND